ncbi:papain family cysteine protease domain-containing protein [Ditylenchus destructor]|uniref:Papain family cysteine protease domain-containing protein n=1 Tax=Ditylenchus destructor TaxID=166010 RepID=A0AAD4N6N5_9BILA|nr:papain family cysteine protease domain-containing protein [Ditylenchus destructor]
MFLSSCLYAFVLTLTFETTFAISPLAENLSGQELVDYVNSRQNLWTAKLNPRFDSMTVEDKMRMTGLKMKTEKGSKNLAESRFLDIDLPKSFDAREHWPKCKSIKQIGDQSHCGSCWAFGAVAAMSDRICIASKGEVQVSLSAADLLSCCQDCGEGCNGGSENAAWQFWIKEGIVTGSNYTAKQGCRPYTFPPCEHHTNVTEYPQCTSLPDYKAPKCEKKCQESYKDKTYDEDKHYGKTFFNVEASVESIQKELYTNGPLEVAFDVMEDFLHYAGGIYSHQAGGRTPYGHAVKLIGWGEENGTPYWTIANSWNTGWGEHGFFRMIRGQNECGIESSVVGGLPDLNRTRIN